MDFAIRPYARADDAAVVAFWTDVARSDSDIQPPTLEFWRGFVERSFNRDGRDFAVAETGGRMVGLLMSTLEESDRQLRNFRIIVDPQHRRKGLGTKLLRYTERQDEARSTTLQADCRRSWEAGTRFLEHHGFFATRDTLWMVVEDTPPGQPPPGVQLRAYRSCPEDDAAWIRLTDEAYDGDPDYTPMTPKDLELLRTSAEFALTFAEAGREIVGLCQVYEYAQKLYVNSLVTRPSWQRRGIARALLLDMVTRLRRLDHVDAVRLTVRAENTPAVTLYRDVGFVVEDTSTTWWKER